MPHRVLVVDDEESTRSLLRDHLEDQGYRVILAGNVREGIRAFKERNPHVIIADFLIPPDNGLKLAEAVRTATERATTPLMMMSGVFKNPKTVAESHEKYQVLDFWSKPLNLDEVSRSVGQAVADQAEDEDPGEIAEREKEAARAAAAAESAAAAVAAVDVSSQSLSAVPVDGSDEPVPPPRGLSYYPSKAPSSSASVSSVTSARKPESVVPSSPPPPRRGSAIDLIKDGIYHGRPFPELPESGDIVDFPVALLLSVLRYDQGTGMLDMSDSGTHRRVYIIEGRPSFMQSNAEGENVGALLLRRGRITEPDFDRCRRYMKDKGRTLQQSLLDLQLVNQNDLATAYKLLAGQLIPLALGMAGGRFTWRETDAFVGRVPEGRFDPLDVLFEGIKRNVHPPQILKFFKGREDIPLVRSLEFENMSKYFRRAFAAHNIASEVDGAQTYRRLTRKHSDDTASVVTQLFALVTSGMAVLPELSEENAMDVAVNQAAAEIALSSDLESEELELDFDEGGSDDAAQRILRFHGQIMSQDFYKILNATPDTDVDTIKATYYELAKRWHTDAFADRDIGAAKSKLDEIFARITEAYETVTHPTKSEEYRVYLDRQARGLPTDPAEVFRAEQLYDQAAAMIRRRDYKGARPVLLEAIRINADPIFEATLGWVTYNLNPESQEHVVQAVKHLKKAVSEQENLPMAYQYLGQICYQRGKASEAKRWWQRCLEWEPNNIEAARGLRMLNARPSSRGGEPSASQQGLLNKFLNNKK